MWSNVFKLPKGISHAPVSSPGRPGCRDRNNPKGCTLDLRGFFRAMARRWLSVTLLALAGLGAGLAVTAASTPQYLATGQIFVSTRASGDIAELNQGSAFSQARVQSYADIISSPRIAGPVVDRLRLKTTPQELAGHISASAKLNTVLIDITVSDTDPERAARIANGVAEEAGRQIVSLETPPGQGTAPVHIGITRTAEAPGAPVSPKPLLNAAAGLLAGLLSGVGLALLRETLDTTLRTAHALGTATGLPVLGSVPFDKGAPDSPLAVGPAAHSARAEAFRLVRTNLQFAQVDRRPRVIMVTSPLPGEGKTNTAANLALSLCETGGRICLVDADLRNPCVAKTFGLVRDAGLTSVLIGQAAVDEVLQEWGDGNLRVLTSGPVPPNPAELLASDRMGLVLADLARDFDTVVVDSAPLLPVADTLGLAHAVDGAVFVVRAGRTPGERVQAAVDSLRSVGAPVLGGVLSMAKLQSEGYGYGYGYGEAAAGDLLVAPRKLGEGAPADAVRAAK
ncbi:polysaccharide biosynthesis tyrosine autokinase [Kitasatospora sp. NPDC093679]|uniref:polysaccharide biosynthesis tyrosine autokinase n=1 Tax=Kitasatospora sp. NPDC093679 TaxID=3154983 RepID=UPI00341ED7C2